MDFSILKNLELVKIGRAADMLWMSIGGPVVITVHKGQKKIVNQYAFHVQCPWRFLQNRRIILGSKDIYERKITLASDTDWDWDVFMGDQSVSGDSTQNINDTLLPLTIVEVTDFNNGDLRITFNKETVFELFIAGSAQCEYWRFIDFEKDHHHVIYEE